MPNMTVRVPLCHEQVEAQAVICIERKLTVQLTDELSAADRGAGKHLAVLLTQ
jgi:hypothetical protein